MANKIIFQKVKVEFVWLEVEIVSDTSLKLRSRKLTVTKTDVYGRLLLLLQQLEVISAFKTDKFFDAI